jgi:flagellar assembly factor FliW
MEFVMQIQTTRFGFLDIEENQLMTFPRGLLGFPRHTRFALIDPKGDSCFSWLQSVDDAALAFVVTDPSIFFKDYEVPVRDETVADLKLTDIADAQVLTICNKVGEWLTGNLLGPLLVNSKNRLGTQVVLTEKKYTTRQPLMKVETQVPLAKSA